jgi:2-oxoglutarate dehydrogenase E1 component
MDFLNFIGNAEPGYVEEQYQQFLADPSSVDPQWRLFFEGFSFAQKNYPVKPNNPQEFSAEFRVLNLINAYRERGHYFTATNPVRTRRKYSPTLDIENFGLKETDLQTTFHAGTELGLGPATLQKIMDVLQQTYCQSIGVEFMYIRNVDVVNWIRTRMESDRNTPHFSKVVKHRILESITKAVGFEKFVHKKFPGYKSFSLEGGESLIPAIEAVIEHAASMDYKEFVIGMPHRGRLNVLTNILHKPFEAIFKEFGETEFDDPTLLGDVKYHLGYSSDTISADSKQIHLTLSPNPSHLEAVNPVVEGIARATAENKYNKNFRKTLPFLIHGDAALAGQGIIYEVIQMSELPGYQTGGTIHFVVNNQLGFTTNSLTADQVFIVRMLRKSYNRLFFM